MPPNWGDELHSVLEDAKKEIEHLRSLAGAVSQGPSFNELAADLPPTALNTVIIKT